jgi:pimeloyl-ACP methyl ester carboxylesterase
MKLQEISTRFAPALDLWNRLMRLAHYDAARKEFVTVSPEHPLINYARVPISGLSELERFMASLEEKLAAIRAPALVVQSRWDPVVDPTGAETLFAQLGSKDKKYLVFDLERHGIVMGEGAGQVHAAIGAFIERVRKGTPAGSQAVEKRSEEAGMHGASKGGREA